MRLSIFIFDGVTALDAIGGYEVLARIPGMEVEFFSQDRSLIAADTRRLGVFAWKGFDDVQSTDILYIPGGPGAFALEEDAGCLQKLRALDATSIWTVGVCNGVGLLAATGALKGRKAATNWFYRDRLARFGAEFAPGRYHRSDKYVTGAGVSASIDAALFLTQLIGGENLAKTLQLGIEYYPDPPFSERAPAEAPDFAKQLVSQFEESGGAEQMRQTAPFANMVRVGP
ncbi:MAG: DJ-1/PfpI family protein [Pseudomonadota bacterium]|nr:DJ-1/PfpI family protein [Pseudomonadota bacterium]